MKENFKGKPREVVGSKAFNLEYEKDVREDALHDEIISYLGEYRFELQKFKYTLEFSRGADGKLGLRDDKKKELMRDKTKRAVEERALRGEPTHREEAEDAGVGVLDEEIDKLQDGERARIFWGSPSGPKAQGYGDYGFIFEGDVHKISKDFATVEMTAIRVEEDVKKKQRGEHSNPYKQALSLLAGQPIEGSNPEDLLRNPKMTKNVMNDELVDKIIGSAFAGRLGKGKYDVFQKVIAKMNPMISQLSRYIRFGSKEDRIKAFHALENYALDLKKRYETVDGENIVYLSDHKGFASIKDMMYVYGKQKPPEVAGSCGSNGEVKSNNPFNKFENLKKTLGGKEEMFECPNCKGEFKPPIGDACPKDRGGCGYTKEQHAKKGGPVC